MTQANDLKPPPLTEVSTPLGVVPMPTLSLVDRLGGLSLCVVTFFAMLSISRANAGLILMLVLAVAFRRAELKLLARDRMVQLTGIFIAYLGVWTLLAIAAEPSRSGPIIESVESWPITGFLALVLTAFWLVRGKVHLDLLLLLFLTGFIVRILMRLEWSQIDTQIAGFIDGSQRATFGYSAVNLGTWSAIALLGLVVLWRRFFPLGRSKLCWFIAMLFWLACLVIAIAALAFSQSRSAWGAVLLVLPPVLLVALYRALSSKRAFAVAFVTLLIAGATVSHNLAKTELVHGRVVAEWDAVLEVFDGESDNRSAEVVAVQARLAMYRLFWERWQERPVFGWGPGSMLTALNQSHINQYTDAPFEHFHSSYFSVMFEYGIVGVVLVAAMLWLILLQLLRGRRAGVIEFDLFLFLLGGFALLLGIALVNEPLQSSNGPYLVSLLGGIAYGHAYRRFLSASASPG